MNDFQAEFERRVKAVLAPEHLGHDTTNLAVEYSGSTGSGCDTCGGSDAAYLIVQGICGCGKKVYRDENLASDEFGLIMRKITADNV